MGRWWKESRTARLRREHGELVRRGAEAITAWRAAEPNALLRLERTNLAEADLRSADLRGARLSRARLDGANFSGANLADALLRHASLRHADLREVRGLTASQLGGCDLTGAQLPASIDVKELATAAQLGEAADYTRRLFMWMLGACAFCALTMAAMPVTQLLTADGQVSLPVLGAAVPTFVFFCAAPAILLAVFHYFHLSLQRLWEKLSLLPAIFPDGEPLDRKTHGWLMFGLVRRHMPQLCERPALFRTQSAVNILAAYGVVPLVILATWWCYALRHDWNRSILHAIAGAVAIHMALGFYALATGTLRGRKRRILLWSRYALSVGALFALQRIMEASFYGDGVLGFNVVLKPQDLSERPSGWRTTRQELGRRYALTVANRKELPPYLRAGCNDEPVLDLDVFLKEHKKAYQPVKGPELANVNLRKSEAFGVFLAHADVSGVDFCGARLWDVDLSYAAVQGTSFQGAQLNYVWLVGASLTRAHLHSAQALAIVAVGADLSDASLTSFHGTGYIDFRKAQFEGAHLMLANLSSALLQGSTFHGADARWCNFAGARLDGAKLTGADLRGATFAGASLAAADFTGAKLGVAPKDNYNGGSEPTNFCGADLSSCVGLTRDQLLLASVDATTKLPQYLLPPVTPLPGTDAGPALAAAPAPSEVVPQTNPAAAETPPAAAPTDQRVADENVNPLRGSRLVR